MKDNGHNSQITIALAGNPNAGKTTLFNSLTGLKQKVANYPGVTVERKEGPWRLNGKTANLIDLPGLYSLDATSLDEQIARDVITGEQAGVPKARRDRRGRRRDQSRTQSLSRDAAFRVWRAGRRGSDDDRRF